CTRVRRWCDGHELLIPDIEAHGKPIVGVHTNVLIALFAGARHAEAGTERCLDLQPQVSSADWQIRIDRRDSRPRTRADGAIDQQLGAEAEDNRHVQRGEQESFAGASADGHTCAPRVCWMSRRRRCSMAQPPPRNSKPNPTRLADRPSLSMTSEK